MKNVPHNCWSFVPQLLGPFGNVLKMDKLNVTLPSMDAHVFISLSHGVELLGNLGISFEGSLHFCPLEILGGLNMCYLCRCEGHIRKNSPSSRLTLS